ncbi:queuosine precursor transporter [Candidatus Woesearchaeota archaeon]|nr:queuosine precursor transporter [Candidatus Woesearchaeota archaeon]
MQNLVHRIFSKAKLNKTQVTIILAGVYIFLQMTADIAAAKVIVLGRIVMDAGIIYSLTFTWRDLIHKQLGKKAARTAIILAGVINVFMALYFLLVVKLPPESSWAALGGQKAFEFVFSLVPRIVIASIIAEVVSELIDTEVYQWWTTGIGKKKPQWLRVVVSNSISIPVDSFLFPLIAFLGALPTSVLVIMFLSNILTKAVITAASFWMIYLVPEKPIYVKE